MILRTSDGMQLSFAAGLKCTQIKDRNGNYITINYDGFGRIDTIRELALAGHEVDGTTAPDYKKDDYLSWSGNFDTVLQRHCAYPFK